MIALVLAAGYATRLYPLTRHFPKPLLEVKDKPILTWLVDDVDGIAGIERILVVSNHPFFPFFEKWKESRPQASRITILDDGSTENGNRLGAVKDILFAIQSLGFDDDMLVLAGDNVLEFSLRRFVDYFHARKASCIMRHKELETKKLQRTGVAVVDGNDLVLEMEEKPSAPKSVWAVPPFYCFRREDLKELPRAIECGCKTDAPGSFISWACSRFPLYAMEMPGKRYDIGNLESYELVKKVYSGIV